jgi:hypothetical protein
MILRAVAVGALTLLLACVKPAVTSAPLDVVVGHVNGRDVEIAGASSSEKTFPTWDSKDEVDVEWRGRWWPATVLERKTSGRYLVHYDGYGNEWDEVVPPERIRLRTAPTPEENNDPVETDSDP